MMHVNMYYEVAIANIAETLRLWRRTGTYRILAQMYIKDGVVDPIAGLIR